MFCAYGFYIEWGTIKISFCICYDPINCAVYYVFTETNFAKTFQECLSKVIDGLRKQNFLCFALRKNNFALAKKDVKDMIWPQYQIGKTQERIVKITNYIPF